jgi:hypothetical protein
MRILNDKTIEPRDWLNLLVGSSLLVLAISSPSAPSRAMGLAASADQAQATAAKDAAAVGAKDAAATANKDAAAIARDGVASQDALPSRVVTMPERFKPSSIPTPVLVPATPVTAGARVAPAAPALPALGERAPQPASNSAAVQAAPTPAAAIGTAPNATITDAKPTPSSPTLSPSPALTAAPAVPTPPVDLTAQKLAPAASPAMATSGGAATEKTAKSATSNEPTNTAAKEPTPASATTAVVAPANPVPATVAAPLNATPAAAIAKPAVATAPGAKVDPAAVPFSMNTPRKDDDYDKRAKDILANEKSIDDPSRLHPLQAAAPDYLVTVCEAGCGATGTHVVTKLSKSLTLTGRPDLTSAVVNPSNPGKCIGGCYSSSSRMSLGAQLSTVAPKTLGPGAGQWMTTVTKTDAPEPAANPAPSKASRDDWMARINRERDAEKAADPKI